MSVIPPNEELSPGIPRTIEPNDHASAYLPSGQSHFLGLKNQDAKEEARYHITVNAEPHLEGTISANDILSPLSLPRGVRVTVFNLSTKASIEAKLNSSALAE